MNKEQQIIFKILTILEHPDGGKWDTRTEAAKKLRDIIRVLQKNNYCAGFDLRSQKEKIVEEFKQRQNDLTVIAEHSHEEGCLDDCQSCQTLTFYDLFLKSLNFL